MERVVTLALLFLSCVHAAPVPRKHQVTLIKDSHLKYALGAGDSQKSGELDGTRTVEVDLREDVAEKAPEIILLENVNSGAGIVLGGSQNLEEIKNKILAFKLPFEFGRKK